MRPDLEEFNQLCALANKEKIPLKCTFELTYYCNLRCCHCYVSPEGTRKELSIDQIISIMEQLFELGTRYIGFTGGEIFVRSDIWDILEHAANLDMKINIKTNATLIDAEAAERLRDLPVTMMEVSMNGATNEVFEAVTGVAGSFEGFMEGIIQLHKRQIPLMFIYTPTTVNWHEGRMVKAFCYEMGQKFSVNPYITPMSPNRRENLRYRLESEKMAEVMLHVSRRRDGRQSGSLFRDYSKVQFFACDIGKSNTVINPYGEMRPCIEIYEPSHDLLRTPLREAWEGMAAYIAGVKPGKNYHCTNCHLRDVCLQCPGHSCLEMDDMSACIPYLKRAAEWVKEEGGDTA